MRVVVTRIEPDGAMHRRMVDTAWQSDPRKWEDLAARALAVKPPYRPVPGTALYHICADGYIVQVGEYDLEGPLRDLVIVVLAAGSQMLAPPPFGTDSPALTPRLPGSARLAKRRHRWSHSVTESIGEFRSPITPDRRNRYGQLQPHRSASARADDPVLPASGGPLAI